MHYAYLLFIVCVILLASVLRLQRRVNSLQERIGAYEHAMLYEIKRHKEHIVSRLKETIGRNLAPHGAVYRIEPDSRLTQGIEFAVVRHKKNDPAKETLVKVRLFWNRYPSFDIVNIIDGKEDGLASATKLGMDALIERAVSRFELAHSASSNVRSS